MLVIIDSLFAVYGLGTVNRLVTADVAIAGYILIAADILVTIGSGVTRDMLVIIDGLFAVYGL